MMIATKVYVPFNGRTGLFPKGTTGEAVLKPFEEGMKRLGVKYLDILYLHDAPQAANVTYGPVLEALQKLKKDGRTKFLGVSVHTNEPEVIRAAVDSKAYDVILTSYNFKQPHVDEVKKAIAYAVKAGLGIVAMKTQAGGFLDRERKEPVNHKAAIKWVLSNPNIHTTIPSFKNFEQMEMFLSVMKNLKLTTEEKADLESARLQAGLYCQQCGQCVAQCTKGVHVPSYMRAFMYAYGYKLPGKAKETIAEIAPRNLPCIHCSTCSVTCTMGFDVKGRIMDVDRVRSIPADFLHA
jgi:predicted aldo/keto reductase-like oxidoreductase